MSGPLRRTSKVRGFEAGLETKLAAGMTQALVHGAAQASFMTPIATSNLLNSQYKQVTKEGGRIVGRVGYTAEYALQVHDPEVKQTFRRASARKEFLRLGFELAEPKIRRILKAALKP